MRTLKLAAAGLAGVLALTACGQGSATKEAAAPDGKTVVRYVNYFTKLQTAVAGGTAADAFELNYENFVTYASNGSLAELKNVDSSAYKKSLYDAFTADGKQ